MLPELPAEMREAQAMGISFFAGEAEGSGSTRCCATPGLGKLKPLYNFMDDLPSLEGEPAPILPRKDLRAHDGPHY